MTYPVVIWAGRLAATLNKSLNRPGTCDPGLEELSQAGFFVAAFGGHLEVT